MKKITTFSLTALACFALSACGSGGGSKENSSTSTVNLPSVINSVGSNQQSGAASGNPVANNDNATGAAFVLSGQDENVSILYKKLTSAENFKQTIVVDGKTVTIAFPGIISGDWTKISDNYTCCGKYSDVRFGYTVGNDPSESDYLFYNGNTTKTMPTSGVAQYNGDFIFDSHDEAYEDLEGDDLTGKATFTADFANKTLVGSMNSSHIEPINVNAAINGNGFKGNAQSASFKTTAELEGKFYGENAKELGGIFTDKKSWGGAFGAAQ